jgi:hypothetical protein
MPIIRLSQNPLTGFERKDCTTITIPLIKAIQPMVEVKKAEAIAGARIAKIPMRIKATLRAINQPIDFLNSASDVNSDIISQYLDLDDRKLVLTNNSLVVLR